MIVLKIYLIGYIVHVLFFWYADLMQGKIPSLFASLIVSIPWFVWSAIVLKGAFKSVINKVKSKA
jgi:hypothetical protein